MSCKPLYGVQSQTNLQLLLRSILWIQKDDVKLHQSQSIKTVHLIYNYSEGSVMIRVIWKANKYKKSGKAT